MPFPSPIYLDHHATTPCDPRVVDAMLPYFTEKFGNAASRTHIYGLQAKAGAEVAREQVAALIGASPKELVWTSGATEADNIAILGVAAAATTRRHLITTPIEHKAVLDPAAHLAKHGWDVTLVAVDRSGVVDVDAIAAAMRPDTALVSVMAANNEIGTLQPIGAIGALCRAKGVVFHCDAVQALGRVPLDVEALNVDLMSLSAHKMYGPKGVGALYVRRRPRVAILPITYGGGHERGLRPGTLPTPLLVGMGIAAELAAEDLRSGAIERIRDLRDRLWDGLKGLGGVHLNGDPVRRLANNLSVAFDDVEAEALMMSCKEIAVSSGSACTSATLEPSHVLRAIGIDPETAHGSIRFGLGRTTSAEEIDRAIAVITEKVPLLRSMNPLLSDLAPRD